MKVNSRVKLLLFVAVLILPSALAYLAYEKFNWRPSSQKNYGELLTPTLLSGAMGTWVDGTLSAFDRTRGKWVLVYVGPSACDESCRESLFYMRQVRILQDAERHRVTLVWVLTDEGRIDEKVSQDVPGLELWHPAEPDFVFQFPKKETDSRHIYLVDPRGKLMMRFPDPPDAKGMAKDLKLLLKASQIG